MTAIVPFTAVPVGLLLGFFLVKGELCGASAFSEVVLMRDARKLGGLWVAAVTSMAVFAILRALELVEPCPRPLLWATYLVAGAVFGAGMVLAGGCVTGTLYKCGVGHLSSMLALLMIPVGLALVAHGPLRGVEAALGGVVLTGPGGAPVTLVSLTGLDFAVLAAVLAAATLIGGILLARRREAPPGATPRARTTRLLLRVLRRPWRPWQAGLLLGLLAGPAWLSSLATGRDFPLGTTDGVEQIPLPLLGPAPDRWISWWALLLVISLVVGANVAARLEGRARLYPRPRGELVIAAIGGLLVGIGAGLGRGCVLGNGVMGTALMSVGMMLFTLTAILANWAVTRAYVMGGLRTFPGLRR